MQTFLYIDIRCDDLSAPVNGSITLCSSGTEGVGYVGDTCSFTCNTGYGLIGINPRTCLSDGSWNGSDNVCERSKYFIWFKSLIRTIYVLYCFTKFNIINSTL